MCVCVPRCVCVCVCMSECVCVCQCATPHLKVAKLQSSVLPFCAQQSVSDVITTWWARVAKVSNTSRANLFMLFIGKQSPSMAAPWGTQILNKTERTSLQITEITLSIRSMYKTLTDRGVTESIDLDVFSSIKNGQCIFNFNFIFITAVLEGTTKGTKSANTSLQASCRWKYLHISYPSLRFPTGGTLGDTAGCLRLV